MNINDAEVLLGLIADKQRLIIVKQLSKNKRLCGNDILKYVECKQATLSHHMSALVEAGLVKAKKNGAKVYYSLNKDLLASLANFLSKDVEEVKEEPKKVVKEVKKEIPIKEDPDIVRDVDRTVFKKEEKKEEKREEKLPTYLL